MKTKLPLVSIAVITYNSTETVCDTLNTVLKQDYDNYEVLIFDDCSTDDTLQKIEQWKKAQPAGDIERLGFTICTSEKNQGVVKNCNRALAFCKGKYILFLAGDDEIFPYSVSECTQFAEQNDLPLVFSKTEFFGGNESLLNVEQAEKIYAMADQVLLSDRETRYLTVLKKNFFPATGYSFVSHQLLQDFGGYDERFPMLDDWPFLLKYLKGDYPVKLLDKPIVRYRLSRSSLCHQRHSAMEESNYDFFRMVRRGELLANGLTNEVREQEKNFRYLSSDHGRGEKFQTDYYQLFQWVALKQQNASIAPFFKERNVHRIAIYGMGDLAYLLLNEIHDTDVSVEYGIDANFQGDYWDLHVYSPKDSLPPVDAIIITPAFAFEKIRDMLQEKCNYNLISLEDVVFSIK